MYCTYCLGLYFISLTTDNASVNDVIMTTVTRCLLARYGIVYTPDMHIRCLAHIINLVVQAFLFGIEEGDDPDKEDWYELNKDTPIHFDIDKDDQQQALDNEELEDDENENGVWDMSEIDNDREDSGILMEPEEVELVELAGQAGSISRVRFSLRTTIETAHLFFS